MLKVQRIKNKIKQMTVCRMNLEEEAIKNKTATENRVKYCS